MEKNKLLNFFEKYNVSEKMQKTLFKKINKEENIIIKKKILKNFINIVLKKDAIILKRAKIIINKYNKSKGNFNKYIELLTRKSKVKILPGEIKLFSNEKGIKKIDNVVNNNDELYIDGKLIDRFKGFYKYNVKLGGVKNINQFYKIVRDQMNKKNFNEAHLVVALKNEDGKYKRATIRNFFLNDEDSFLDAVQKMESGEAYGSDIQEHRLDGYKIVFDGFELNKFVIFDNENINGKNDFIFGTEIDLTKEKFYIKNQCMINSLIYRKRDKEKEIIEYFKDKENNITEFINGYKKFYGKEPKILYDFPNIFKFDDFKKPGKKNYDYIDNKNKEGFFKIKYNDLSEFNKGDPGQHKFIYCNNHIAPYNGISDKKLYYNASCNIYELIINKKGEEEMKKIKSRRECNLGRKEEFFKETGYNTIFISFDIETIFNAHEDGLLTPYSISWVKTNNKNEYYTGFIYGDNVCDKFINILYDEYQKNNKIVLMGYNNSNFDNYYIVKSLAKKHDFINNIFYCKNSILNIKFGGRHETFDLCRFTLCSLKKCCENYKTTLSKKGDFNHIEIQDYYNKNNNLNGFFKNKDCVCDINKIHLNDFSIYGDDKYKKLDEEINKEINNCDCNFKKLMIYNLYDVLSVIEIYDKLNQIFNLNNMFKKDEFLYQYKTIGSFIYKKFDLDRSNQNIKIPLLNIDEYKNCRKYLTAGRTECLNGQIFDKNNRENDDLISVIDVVSLYPSSMLNNIYPWGLIFKRYNYDEKERNIEFYRDRIYDKKTKEEIETKEIDWKIYNKYFNDKIGFFWCEFDQENLKYNILPRRYDENGKKLVNLDWKYKGKQKQFLNTVDIKQLIKYNCNVNISTGFVFSDIIKGSQLFNIILNFKKLKQDQDNFKINDPKKYNEAARQTYKIFLNSLSGKVIEGLHMEQTQYINNEKKFKDILKNMFEENEDEINNIDLMQKVDEDHFIINYKISEEEAFKMNNRPIYLGILIYAYSRQLMYDRIFSKYDVFYTDTDSAFITHKDLKNMKIKYPNWFGTEFGQFDIEKKDIQKQILIAPKNYFLIKDNKVIKKGFKGVNMNKDILLPFNDDEIKKIKNDILNKNIGFENYNIKFSDYSLSNEKNINKMIEIMNEKKYCYILRSKLRKIKHDIMIEEKTGIYQNYDITKINI